MAKKKKAKKREWLVWQLNGIRFAKDDVLRLQPSDLVDSFINQFMQSAEKQFRVWRKQYGKKKNNG